MTSTPDNPGSTDFEGKAVPPYEGPRGSAEVDSEQGQLHHAGTTRSEDVDFRDPFEHDEDGGEG
jgi:hypothetical protein